ncbi:hypothetical protein LPJ75_001325, partial [Coemansia sp. RSA 2598]
MARSTVSLIAAAWILAASYAHAGPIATAADNAATSSELASLGGLLQALGAGVIGNGALLYPTAASSHQRAESEILASDTATRVFKKVKSILKDGGLNDDDNGDDSSKSITYLIKPALIFHKEELAPPNPLAGNVLPLPGGALLYTPTPTANGAAGNLEPTNGPAASIKAAYGNLFAASPYTPSYTLNKPHAAVIVEEVTDMISLKSVLQREEDAGEDVEDNDDDDDEDEFGHKRRKRPAKIISLETIDSTSTFVNPFTRADFPFGIVTPQSVATPAPTSTKKEEGSEESISKKNQKKTIKKTVSAKTTSTASAATSGQLSASMGKDGAITVVNNAASPTTTATGASQGTTIVIPAASLQNSSSGSVSAAASSPASSSSGSAAAASGTASHSAESSSGSAHEESSSKNEDLNANEVTRFANLHKSTSAKPDLFETTKAGGVRRDVVASSNDPLSMGGATLDATAASSLSSLAMTAENKDAASPSVTIGSTAASPELTSHTEAAVASASSDLPRRRKMHIVRVYEVKKNKHSGTVETVTVATSTSAAIHKRGIMPMYDSEPTAAPYFPAAAAAAPAVGPIYGDHVSATPVMADGYPLQGVHVGNLERLQKQEEEDSNEEDSDTEDESSKKGNAEADASHDRAAETKSKESTTAGASAESSAESSSGSSASAESSSASAESSSASASAESSSAESSVAKDATVASPSFSSSVASTSASAESSVASSVSDQSTSSATAAAESVSSSSASRNTSAKSLSIETVGSVPAASAKPTVESSGSTSKSVDGDNKSDGSDSDSDSGSDSESDNESDVKRNKDTASDSDSESDDEGKSQSGNKQRDEAEEEESEEEGESSDVAPKRRHALKPHAVRVNRDESPLQALQRVAALGMREAERAALDYEENSESDNIEMLTTEDAKHSINPASSSSASADGAAPTKQRAADDKDEDEDNEKDEDSDADSDDDGKDGKSADSDSDEDSDSDDESMSKPRKSKGGLMDDRMALGSNNPQATSVADKAADEDPEELAARKALSEAAAESAKQVVNDGITELENVASESAETDASG